VYDFIRPAPKPVMLTESITYKTFENNSFDNQLLIIVESWGLPANPEDWESLKIALRNVVS